jgi:hypothetical protein
VLIKDLFISHTSEIEGRPPPTFNVAESFKNSISPKKIPLQFNIIFCSIDSNNLKVYMPLPILINIMESPPPTLTPQISLQIGDKKQDNQEFYRWINNQKQDFKEDIIFFLSRMKFSKYKESKDVKSSSSSTGKLKVSQNKEGYMTLDGKTSEPPDALMPLNSAIEIAELIAMELDAVHSTTWTDPATHTNRIAALFGLAAGHMLDNPRYEFKGNETDVQNFVLMICKTMQSVADRSKGGLFMKAVSESTVNYESKSLSSSDMNPTGGYQMPRRPSFTDRIFAPRR